MASGGPFSRYRFVEVVQVGGKAWRSVDFDPLRYARGRIEFDTREYRDNDPFYCPGKPPYLLDRLCLKEPGASWAMTRE